MLSVRGAKNCTRSEEIFLRKTISKWNSTGEYKWEGSGFSLLRPPRGEIISKQNDYLLLSKCKYYHIWKMLNLSRKFSAWKQFCQGSSWKCWTTQVLHALTFYIVRLLAWVQIWQVCHMVFPTKIQCSSGFAVVGCLFVFLVGCELW